MKSSRFHEICEIQWISPMKSGGFHPEIWWISWNLWNPADFTCEIWWISWNLVDFTLKSGRFHEIQWISWNPWNLVDFRWNLADFTQIWPVKSTQNYKSKCFSKNSSVWWMQGGGFHPRNPVDFTLKSGGFQPWNLADFTCEIHPKL